MLRLALPLALAAARASRAAAELAASSRVATVEELLGASWSNFLAPRRHQGRLRDRRRRRRDRARRRGGRALRDPGEALLARLRARQRRHRSSCPPSPSTKVRATSDGSASACCSRSGAGPRSPCSSRCRSCSFPTCSSSPGSAKATREAPTCSSFSGSSAIVHQPVSIIGQYLMATRRQRRLAEVLVPVALGNVLLSVLAARWFGIEAVAWATLVTDVVVLAALTVVLRSSVGVGVQVIGRSILRPALPAALGAVVVLAGLGALFDPTRFSGSHPSVSPGSSRERRSCGATASRRASASSSVRRAELSRRPALRPRRRAPTAARPVTAAAAS